jgi:hypothetical protein
MRSGRLAARLQRSFTERARCRPFFVFFMPKIVRFFKSALPTPAVLPQAKNNQGVHHEVR